jgi:hypothetical protein
MKRISYCWFASIGSLAVLLALSTLARSDDSSDATSTPSNAEANREESAASVASTYAPNMIGDMGGGPSLHVRLPTDQSINVPSPSTSFLGRQKLADNDCVLPTDRVFCDYSYFHDAYLATTSDANRFVPGFEKTFLDGQMSVEMRFPLGIQETNNLAVSAPVYGNTGQFGDIQVITKAILLQRDTWTLCTGMGISLPTAPDLNVLGTDGSFQVKIADRSVHLLPFVGLLVKPDDDWFAQAFVQVDVAANGNAVSVANKMGPAPGLTSLGDINDEALIFADVSIGRWLYHDPAQRFSGLAAVFEVHYAGGLNAPSGILQSTSGYTIGNLSAQYNILDLTIGAHAVVGNTTLSAGYVTPVTMDRWFEGELRVFANWKF